MEDKKILVVFTGGTIGSTIENNVIDVSGDTKYILLNMYKELEENKNIMFDTISPVNMLSENATIEDWNQIVKSIKEKELSKYKGIIITHGTDTLGYFANALQYMLNKVEIPIVLVSSNLVLTNKNANGLDNFKIAVDFIIENSLRGVYVAYKNTDGNSYIHKGTQVKQIAELSEDVYSINNQYFAKIINKSIEIKDKNSIKLQSEYNYEFKPKMDGILYIKPFVGQKYDFDIDKYRIIYHEMFHSGTIPQKAMELIKKCKDKNKLFFMGVSHKTTGSLYAPTEEAIKAGAIMLTGMSQEATIIKLMMANGTFNSNEEIINFMKNNIVGEIMEK